MRQFWNNTAHESFQTFLGHHIWMVFMLFLLAMMISVAGSGRS